MKSKTAADRVKVKGNAAEVKAKGAAAEVKTKGTLRKSADAVMGVVKVRCSSTSIACVSYVRMLSI